VNEQNATPQTQGPQPVNSTQQGSGSSIDQLANQLMNAIKMNQSIPAQEKQAYMTSLQQLVRRTANTAPPTNPSQGTGSTPRFPVTYQQPRSEIAPWFSMARARGHF
jgi:hypothetical protein